MKRILFITVLLAVAMLFVGCATVGSPTDPTADAPENPQEPGSKYTPTELNNQADATFDESVDRLEAVAE